MRIPFPSKPPTTPNTRTSFKGRGEEAACPPGLASDCRWVLLGACSARVRCRGAGVNFYEYLFLWQIRILVRVHTYKRRQKNRWNPSRLFIEADGRPGLSFFFLLSFCFALACPPARPGRALVRVLARILEVLNRD